MAIDIQLFRFMPHVVTIEPYASVNVYGEDQVSGSRIARAYVTPNKTHTNGMQVNEETRPLTAYIADTKITLRDKITLPDGSAPEIRSIEIHLEVEGLEHTVVNFS